MKQCPLCKIYLEDEQHLSEHAEGAHNSRFIDMKPQNKRNLSQEVTDMTVEYIKGKPQNKKECKHNKGTYTDMHGNKYCKLCNELLEGTSF